MAPLTGRKLIYTINFVAGLAIFFFGYDQGMMGGVNTAPNYVELMDLGYATYEGKNEGWVATITNTPKQGGIVSVYYLGTLIGALIAGVMGDRIGRIKTMFHGSLWVCFGAALQCSSQNLAWILCARIINGIGTGYLNAVVPVWSAEVSSHKSRGAFIAMEFTLNIFGVVVAYWLSYGLGYIDEGASQFRWRFPMAFQLVPITIFMFSLHWMPESPRWLLKVGKEEEAKEVLQRLRADDENPAQAESELRDIADVVGLELKHRKMNNYWNMFWGIGDGDLHVARRVQLAIWLQIIQEWTGIAAITVYAPVIFTQAGYSSRKSEWVSGLNDITYMFSTVLATYTIDRWGRRIGLWWGAVGQGISMFLAGGFSRLLKDHPDQASQYGGAATLFVFLYTAIFGATWLDIPWVYPTEIYPLQVRAKGNALGVVGWSIGNGWLMMLNPVMFSKIAENTFYIFAAVNFASIPIVWAFYPETANRTLEELDILFSAKSPFTWDAEKRFKEVKEQIAHGKKLEEVMEGPGESISVDEHMNHEKGVMEKV